MRSVILLGSKKAGRVWNSQAIETEMSNRELSTDLSVKGSHL